MNYFSKFTNGLECTFRCLSSHVGRYIIEESYIAKFFVEIFCKFSKSMVGRINCSTSYWAPMSYYAFEEFPSHCHYLPDLKLLLLTENSNLREKTTVAERFFFPTPRWAPLVLPLKKKLKLILCATIAIIKKDLLSYIANALNEVLNCMIFPWTSVHISPKTLTTYDPNFDNLLHVGRHFNWRSLLSFLPLQTVIPILWLTNGLDNKFFCFILGPTTVLKIWEIYNSSHSVCDIYLGDYFQENCPQYQLRNIYDLWLQLLASAPCWAPFEMKKFIISTFHAKNNKLFLSQRKNCPASYWAPLI